MTTTDDAKMAELSFKLRMTKIEEMYLNTLMNQMNKEQAISIINSHREDFKRNKVCATRTHQH